MSASVSPPFRKSSIYSTSAFFSTLILPVYAAASVTSDFSAVLSSR